MGNVNSGKSWGIRRGLVKQWSQKTTKKWKNPSRSMSSVCTDTPNTTCRCCTCMYVQSDFKSTPLKIYPLDARKSDFSRGLRSYWIVSWMGIRKNRLSFTSHVSKPSVFPWWWPQLCDPLLQARRHSSFRCQLSLIWIGLFILLFAVATRAISNGQMNELRWLPALPVCDLLCIHIL